MSEIIQPVLFNSPRPTYADERIITYIVDKIFEDFYDWFKSTRSDNYINSELIKRDLISFFNENKYEDDGYRLAKELDCLCGYYDYVPDAALVEILDAITYLRYDTHKELEQIWVKENGMMSPFNIGDNVKHIPGKYKGMGEVLKNDEYGYAHVYFPDSGHVKVGNGTRAGIIKWEDLELINGENI